jgi:hypothetical protein
MKSLRLACPNSSNLKDTRGNLGDTKGNLEDTRGNLKDTRGNLEDTRGNLEDTTENPKVFCTKKTHSIRTKRIINMQIK